ncbi:uncharacterized protein [Parasteatoda tepidariorum]|uniref:uncharacterized protein n=1 Tax=Parasteatoda tepidariorum TaxID=114398 RepID=UPI0039BCA195
MRHVKDPWSALLALEIEIVLLTEFSEYPIPKTKPGLIIAIHDRKQLVNPFLSGDVLYGGDKYQLRIEKEIQTSLLPAPYDTNCTDYLTQWEQNDGTGPLDSQDCINNCILDNLISIESCIPDDFFVPHNQDICEDLARKNIDLDTYKESCAISCGNPCFERTYVTRLLKEGELTCDSSTNDSLTNFEESQFCTYNNISLTLLFNQFMLSKIVSVPRIQNQEIASYIGGCLRFWMDITFVLSLPADEYLDSLATPSVYFILHDSSRIVNPFRYGIHIKAPGNHLIQVNDYIEQYLLPYPYDTNCLLLNLEVDTDENFDSMDCLENCNFNLHMEQYGCAPRSISISHMARLCKKGVKVTQRNNDICIKKCNRMPCISRMFKFKHLKNKILDKNYTYQEMKQKSIGLYEITRNIMISVSFRNMKARITKLIPKMVPIDLFSNIGGFLGIWIGSSLISLSDLLYRLTDYIVFHVKKNKY